jgi:RNA 2',3'-cyclic 3'-phosphodiesterase
MAADRARVFFALWPGAHVAQALAAAAREAQAECGGRPTAPEKIHLTLFFVGDVERGRIVSLQALAGTVRTNAFSLDFDAIGYWRHNRIVWGGMRRCAEALSRLVANLQERLLVEGIESETRPYVPHVTLVRNAQRGPKRTRLGPLAWDADDFVLVESVPAGGGVRYDVIGRWPLLASA